jgi:hypothetical protein
VYGLSYLYSLKTAFFSTLICLGLGYPMAYAIARTSKSTQNILLLIIILPFWTSFLLRVYALEGIIRDNGLLNTAAAPGPHPPAAADHAHQPGGLPRHHLFVPALHGPAAVRHAGESSIIPCSRRPPTSAARPGAPSSTSRCPCPCRA